MRKPLLIIESLDFIAEKQEYDKSDNCLRLSGTFAVFDKINQNGRIYEAKEYLPHLEYLNEKAKAKRLMGELDHPEKFDVSLKNVSHLIEKVWHDEKENKIKGTIKLLNTQSGKDARAIIEGGGVLSISSRAAGAVNESTKKVNIKRIFTYDLVAEPGFPNAQLFKVNEKYGITNENVSVYEVSDKFISNVTNTEIKNFLNEMIAEMNPNEEILLNEEQKYIENNNNKKEIKMNTNKEYVTKTQLNEYSKVLKENLNSLNLKINSLKENTSVVPKNESVNEMKNVIKYSNHLAENLNEQESKISKLEGYVNYLATKLEESINYAEYLGREIGSDVKELKENHIKTVKFTNYLAENLDKSIQHTDYLAEGMNDIIGFNNYIAENLNNLYINTEELSEKTLKLIKFADYLAENLESGIGFSNYLAENLNKSIVFANYLAENLDTSIQYSEYIAENSLAKLPSKEDSTNESKNEKKTITNLNETLNNFLSAVEKQKTVGNKETEIKSMLTGSNAIKFNQLNEADKRKVMTAVIEQNCKSEKAILEVWENVLINPADARLLELHKHRPIAYNEAWESLTESQKEAFEAKAKFYDLSSPIRIKDFWFKSNLLENFNQIKTKVKNENEELFKKINENTEIRRSHLDGPGYSVDSLDAAKNTLLSRLKR